MDQRFGCEQVSVTAAQIDPAFSAQPVAKNVRERLLRNVGEDSSAIVAIGIKRKPDRAEIETVNAFECHMFDVSSLCDGAKRRKRRRAAWASLQSIGHRSTCVCALAYTIAHRRRHDNRCNA
ncbi:hypothetical protein H7F36_11995 [Variovorax sp. PAMC28562]|uniref:hypothetical protein n=1 Tax=Variovorax sp. PAMC28562 TaxID=2762323 RepID=UPI00164EB206|nr:hypothetical protein [Variovorax sp. PAMC28562]QNK71981.1 hypothetical protein H7F36_11995 [Variovorax sp. PAMC28562]